VEGAQRILSALQYNTTLTQIHVAENKIPEAFVRIIDAYASKALRLDLQVRHVDFSRDWNLE
jgi:hypothetical protein